MFDASQSILIKHGDDVYCDTIKNLYDRYHDSNLIYTATSEEATWIPIRLVKQMTFAEQDFVYRMDCEGENSVIATEDHTLNHMMISNYRRKDYITVSRRPFFDCIKYPHSKYADGFIVGLYIRGGYEDDGMFGIVVLPISTDVISYIKKNLAYIERIRYDITYKNLERSVHGSAMGCDIKIENYEALQAFVHKFTEPNCKCNLNAVLYGEAFRRGVLDGIRLFDHRYDTDFSFAVMTKADDDLTKLIQALAVSLGQTTIASIGERVTFKTLITPVSTTPVKESSLKVENVYKQTPSSMFAYNIEPLEPISGQIILPNGILIDFCR